MSEPIYTKDIEGNLKESLTVERTLKIVDIEKRILDIDNIIQERTNSFNELIVMLNAEKAKQEKLLSEAGKLGIETSKTQG